MRQFGYFNRILIRVFIFLLVLGIGHTFAVPTADKLNVIILMTDDQGWSDLGCHGHPIVRTPNLDRMHDQSVRLTDFHVDPFCAPTRAALMTGRISQKTGVTSTYGPPNLLRLDEVIMPQYFKTAGYHTGMFGKWHLGGNYPRRPMDRGFDQWVGLGNGGLGISDDLWDNDRMNDRYWQNGEVVSKKGFCTDVYFREAMSFAEKAKAKNNPFFIYLPTNVPHRDNNVPSAWLTPYLDAGCNLDQAAFYAGIERVDWNMGRLMKFLDQESLADSTLLLFLTDNGSILPQRKLGTDIDRISGMRGMKGKLYEGGHRVPCFIKGPEEVVGKPRDISAFAAHLDLLPTFIELCGLAKPPQVVHSLDGRNLLPLFQGKKNWQDRTLFLHHQNGVKGPQKYEKAAVLTKDWRLIYHSEKEYELYQIKEDPSQQTDLSAENPEMLKSLEKAYEEFWDSLDHEKASQRPILSRHATTHLSKGWQRQIRQAKIGNRSNWEVKVADSGTYRIEIRRWPREAGKIPMQSGLPPVHDPDIQFIGGKSGNIRGVALDIESVELTSPQDRKTIRRKVSSGDEAVSLDLDLPKGDFEFSASMILANGQKMAPPYIYATLLH